MNKTGKNVGIHGLGDFFTEDGFNEDMKTLSEKKWVKTITKPFVPAYNWSEALVTGDWGTVLGGLGVDTPSGSSVQFNPDEFEPYDVCDGVLSETTLAFEVMLTYDVPIYALFNALGLDMSKCLRLDCLHPEYQGNVCTECIIAEHDSPEQANYCGHCAAVVHDEYESMVENM